MGKTLNQGPLYRQSYIIYMDLWLRV